MASLNSNYSLLANNYLFAEVAKRTDEYKKRCPDADIIKMGIGDVTRPLAAGVVAALERAAHEQLFSEGFAGYGPYEGYGFLRNAISDYYRERGVKIAPDEIYVSDGAKSDLGNMLELFASPCRVVIPDPVYPAYVDSNVMCGNEIIYVRGNAENGFLPEPPEVGCDIIYMCSPNNPTGACYDAKGLSRWVEYALSCKAVIFFDAAYERFAANGGLPRSIYCIDDARRCAVEFNSFSKSAGFTGLRCGYVTIPRELVVQGENFGEMWLRRQSVKYNGTPYVVQRAAEAALGAEGLADTGHAIEYYRENALIMSRCLDETGIFYTGGTHSPYIWFACPHGISSWEMFDLLLERAGVVCTPGEGFGESGKGFCRLTAFGDRERTAEAMRRFKKLVEEL